MSMPASLVRALVALGVGIGALRVLTAAPWGDGERDSGVSNPARSSGLDDSSSFSCFSASDPRD